MVFGMSLDEPHRVVLWQDVLLDLDLLYYKNVYTDDGRQTTPSSAKLSFQGICADDVVVARIKSTLRLEK